ncbi:neuroguidin [Hoplias malabaricus]|uniref:neuroguidin n=1 Tax=Hoplias malabaricus TaxID=27720 RepID=UPI003462CD26
MAALSVSNDAVIEDDLPKAVQLLNKLTEQVVSVTSHVRDLIKKVQEQTYHTKKGLSFLDVKYHLLLFYLQDLAHLLATKTEGRTFKDSDAIQRLVTIRTILEKMRPLDQKLKYQIDKLVRTAVTGSLAENDPLHFRPNPENLVSKLSENEDEEGEDEDGEKTVSENAGFAPERKYRPPKIAPMHYSGDLTDSDKHRELAEKQRRAALRSSVIQELRHQYSDHPEEIRDKQDTHTERELRDEQHRRNYEESMMVRLSAPRDQRNRKRRMGMTSQLGNITHFSDITALTGGQSTSTDLSRPKKKKKKVLKKKSKKRLFKKRS